MNSGRSEVIQTWCCLMRIHLTGSDVSAATCQLATRLQSPTECDVERTEEGVPLLERKSSIQACMTLASTIDVKLRLLTNSDWANEARSLQSHSGGALLGGGHLLQ